MKRRFRIMEDVQAALLRFLRAFSRLQLDEMMGFFADDATAFFPIEHQRARDGRRTGEVGTGMWCTAGGISLFL